MESQPVFFDPLLNPSRDAGTEDKSAEEPIPVLPWTLSVLIIVPLRLGLDRLNSDYTPGLLKALEMPQSVGILGGREHAFTR